MLPTFNQAYIVRCLALTTVNIRTMASQLAFIVANAVLKETRCELERRLLRSGLYLEHS